MKAAAVFLIALGCAGAAAGSTHGPSTTTGAIELGERFVTARLHTSVDAYRADIVRLARREDFVAVHTWPAEPGDNPRYGTAAVAGRIRTYVVDRAAHGGWTLRCDDDADGDLAEESTQAMISADGRLRGDCFARRPDAPQAPPVPWAVEIETGADGLPEAIARLYIETRRSALVRVGEYERAFAVVGSGGRFEPPYARYGFDLDGDGDVRLEDPWSGESLSLDEPFVAPDGLAFDVILDGWGDRLELRARSDKPASRPRIGAPAPDFDYRDLDGRDGRLSDHRGRVVLVYFWGTWCAPCRPLTLELVATHRRLGERGLTLLGVNRGDDAATVRAYAAETGASWPQTLQEDGGAILALYRIDHYPTLLLIGRDGTLLAADLSGDALLGALDTALSQDSPPRVDTRSPHAPLHNQRRIAAAAEK